MTSNRQRHAARREPAQRLPPALHELVGWLRWTLAAAVVLVLLTSCGSYKPASGSTLAAPARGVVLWGDSFGESVAPYLPYDERVYGGTAPCDWLHDVQRSPAPATAVLLFVGNKLGAGCDYPSAVAQISRSLATRGTRVVWIAAPLVPVSPLARPYLNALYPGAAHGPADSIGGEAYWPRYRGPDGQHLNTAGARRFADAIKAAVLG